MKQNHRAMDFEYNGWRIENDFLSKAFHFPDFKAAMLFVSGLGEIAQKADHCPEILVHSCSNVEVFLRSHDQNDITERDLTMARQIDHFLYTEEILSRLH